jgi:DNA double-strand break repair helicase HerA and related ATPase
MIEPFKQQIKSSYTPCESDSLTIGCGMYQGQVLSDCPITIALKTLNRHGLIAGATGTGKTKTIQMFVEQLSKHGVASLVMDIKGDLSGLAFAGKSTDKILARAQALDMPFEPQSNPVEFLSISDEVGVKLRATITEFGPMLLSKILGLNDTQASVVTILMAYAKENQLPVVDLDDMKELIRFALNEGKEQIEQQYGGIANASLKAILRKLLELATDVSRDFFSEPSFDVNDLLGKQEGKGIISIMRLASMQRQPKVFSTFMLGLFDEVYQTFPEIGDVEKPKLILFIDEAHLLFKNASKALLDKLETMVKLIRSKGVGLIFCSQSPKDIPEAILSQLGLKIQHALRAFTAKDRKAIKLIAQNFPETSFYDTESMLTTLSIGEALVSALDVKGQPTALIQCMIRPPHSRMGVISDSELCNQVQKSLVAQKYADRVENKTAKALLAKKMEKNPEKFNQKIKESSVIEQLSKNTLVRQVIRTIFKELTRALMNVLGIKKRGSKRR